jgi:uncharacterized protein (TIGR04255 family)
MSELLPRRLRLPPVVEVVFEVRFDAAAPASQVLPGLLYSNHRGDGVTVEATPAASVPLQIRNENSQEFANTPLSRVTTADYIYLVGDSSLAIACRYPYKGWEAFRVALDQAILLLQKSGLAKLVTRYSLRYDNIFERSIQDQQSAFDHLNIKMTLASIELPERVTILRTEIEREGVIHIVQLVSSATYHVQTPIDHAPFTRSGSLLQIDSVVAMPVPVGSFFANFSSAADALHAKSKSMFFSLLTNSGLQALGPEYEHK